MAWGATEQEVKIQELFTSLEAELKKLGRIKDSNKTQVILREVTKKLKDAKTLILEFEREARTDGMPARELADRKRRLANQLNEYINLKKQYTSTEEGRNELLAGSAPAGAADSVARTPQALSMQELMKDGRKNIHEIDSGLTRAEKLVEDTVEIGKNTAATLHDQSQQLNKIVDDLNEIEFTMKKATKIIADIGKGIMTDRCIMFLLFLVVCGVIALVIVKVVKPHKAAIAAVTSAVIPANATQAITSSVQQTVGTVTGALTGSSGSRKMLMDMQQHCFGAWPAG